MGCAECKCKDMAPASVQDSCRSQAKTDTKNHPSECLRCGSVFFHGDRADDTPVSPGKNAKPSRGPAGLTGAPPFNGKSCPNTHRAILVSWTSDGVSFVGDAWNDDEVDAEC